MKMSISCTISVATTEYNPPANVYTTNITSSIEGTNNQQQTNHLVLLSSKGNQDQEKIKLQLFDHQCHNGSI